MVRKSREDAARTRRAIVETASRLIRERGIASVSIADVMGALGLTVGGFYRHFDDKETLVSEAIDAASIETIAAMKKASEGTKGPKKFGVIAEGYLSREHFAHPGQGCPVAALASEAWHDTKATRAALQRAVERMLALLELDKSVKKRDRRRMLSALSTAVGALVLGRVLEGTVTGEELVESARVELRGGRR
jgi:TetR/AcrR family transcriptional repressor of nem operon